jgi:hypothetical protein
MIRTIAIRVWDSHSRNGRRIRLRSTWIARKLPLLRRIKMLGRNMSRKTVMGKARRQRRICEFTIQHSLSVIEAKWNQKPSGPAWPSSPTSGIVYTVRCGFEAKPAMYLLPSSRHILEDTTVNGSWPKNGSAFRRTMITKTGFGFWRPLAAFRSSPGVRLSWVYKKLR